jgi:two-component system LytT family sensor kinase
LDITTDAYRCEVPSLLLQPLVENSVKYAISKSKAGGTIQVTACVRDGSLDLAVEDSGPDEDDVRNDAERTQADTGVGVGLPNVRQRLETLFGARAHCRSTSSVLGGMRVEICIPAQEAA